MSTASQPRERAVACRESVCRRLTWNVDRLCDDCKTAAAIRESLAEGDRFWRTHERDEATS